MCVCACVCVCVCARTTVWKQEWSWVRKCGLSSWASTLFSTMVHSTSSSWITTSFFRILMAYKMSESFISANITYTHTHTHRKRERGQCVEARNTVCINLCTLYSQ